MNIFKKIQNFFNQTISELKKVNWLNRKTLRNYTILVLVTLTIGTLFILFFDEIFLLIRNLIIK